MIVPKYVADKEDTAHRQHGLFEYLKQVRLAYIIGADLAAIALCRTVTELLMRSYYSNDEETDLPRLIRSVQSHRDFRFLEKLNLVKRVREAIQIMHAASTRGERGTEDDALPPPRDRARIVARNWVTALEHMISNAPGRGSSG
jgi:hypothetical protein